MVNLVSVIVPVYNVEEYLEKCINSLLKQTYSNIEIILIDDGSTDKSLMICEQFEFTHKNIKVIHKKNGGVSSARNLGVETANGRYIVFVDADDWVEERFISELCKLISKENVQLGIVGYRKIENNNNVKECKQLSYKTILLSQIDALNKILNRVMYLGYMCNKIFDKEIIVNNNIKFNEDIKIWEDLVFCCQYIRCINYIEYYNMPLYNYCIRENSAATSGDYKIVRTSIIAVEILIGMMKEQEEKHKEVLEPFCKLAKELYSTIYINNLTRVEFKNRYYDKNLVKINLMKAKQYLEFVNFKNKVKFYLLLFAPKIVFKFVNFKRKWLLFIFSLKICRERVNT